MPPDVSEASVPKSPGEPAVVESERSVNNDLSSSARRLGGVGGTVEGGCTNGAAGAGVVGAAAGGCVVVAGGGPGLRAGGSGDPGRAWTGETPGLVAGGIGASWSSHEPIDGRSYTPSGTKATAMMITSFTGLSDLQKPLNSGFVADHPGSAARVAIPLYLMKSSGSLHFLNSNFQPNEETHYLPDVNGVVQ